MSEHVRKLVRDHSSLRRGAKSVLLAIAAYVRDDGSGAYPSVSTLAKDTGLSVRAVQYGLKACVNSDELKRIHNHGPNGVNQYIVRIDRLGGRAREMPSNGSASSAPGAISADKGSSLKGSNCISSGSKIGRRFSSSVLKPESDNGSRPSRQIPPERFDTDLLDSFDKVMRQTVDIGKPSPYQLASEAALRRAYADWEPYKVVLKTGERVGRGDRDPPSLEQEWLRRTRAMAEWDELENPGNGNGQEPNSGREAEKGDREDF